jgi:hypothetical protein
MEAACALRSCGLKVEAANSSKLRNPSTKLHGVTFKKISIFAYFMLPYTRLKFIYEYLHFLATGRRI